MTRLSDSQNDEADSAVTAAVKDKRETEWRACNRDFTLPADSDWDCYGAVVKALWALRFVFATFISIACIEFDYTDY